MKMKTKRLWAALLCCAMLLCVQFAGAAEGDFSGYTAISTKAQLNAVRNDLSGKYYLTADLVFTGSDFVAGGAFYNGGRGFPKIGSEAAPFSGIFDGNGHTIKGLYMEAADSAYTGLFGYNSGTVQNLRLVDVNITGDRNVGGIAGYNKGTLINCSVAGYVEVKDCFDPKDYGAGGIAGVNYGNIKDCASTCSVTVGEENWGSPAAGGIAGQHYGTISGCHNTGSVWSKAYAGGIAGKSEGSISYCYNTGNICAFARAGGIVGRCEEEATISSCYNTGSVSNGTPNISNASAGGLAGYNYGIVSNCYNTGSINSNYETGGIAGENTGAIRNCYNVGSTTGYSFVGGIAGLNFLTNEVYGTVSGCYYLNATARGVDASRYMSDPAVLCPGQQMENQETFEGFDFDSVWTMDGNKNYPYPQLQGVPMQNCHVHRVIIRYRAATALLSGAWLLDCDGCKEVIGSAMIYSGYPFDDVRDSSAWFYPYAAYGKAYHLFKNKTFNGSANITRAEFVTTLCRTSLGGFLTENEILAKYSASIKDDFSDVKGQWYAPYARYMKELGVVGGSYGKFNGNAPITREEVAAMVHRLVKLVDPKERLSFGDPVAGFADMNDVASWFKADIEWARKTGLLTGSYGKLLPKKNNSRTEMAVVLQRFTMRYWDIVAV